MRVVATDIPGLLVIERAMFLDRRGAFHEAFAARDFAAAGLPSSFLQISDSHSRPGVLRGLHLQWPAAQAKLVRVVAGRIFDVVVDLRPGSATWGRWAPFTLAADENRMLFIPEGFAHGFASLSDSVVIYHLGVPYDPAGQITIAWNDPELAIDWPIREPIMSPADAAGISLAAFKRRFELPQYQTAG
ncbi:MAG TPA: dTDP-4-dehydrorhamnose 3,5-epimerase [Alphaproteobacteria bacterium]